MTPRPRKATFAIVFLLQYGAQTPICRSDCDGAARPSTRHHVDRIEPPPMVRPRNFAAVERRAGIMAVTKEQVLASLHGVASPDGTPLPKTGTLSDVVAGDGKVFFSITVDAGAVKAWESVRKRAEEAVRALPGVTSALVALTAERKAGAAAPQAAPSAGTSAPGP